MNIRLIRQFFYCVALFLVSLLAGCGNTPGPSLTPALKALTTATARATWTPFPTIRPRNTPEPTFDETAYALASPSLTPTGTPLADAEGNVTWHPQKKLISWSDGGGDGYYYHHDNFILYWDGTLLQEGKGTSFEAPYITKLSQTEVCKILNTVDSSDFFDERDEYSFPFMGASSSSINVSAWKSNWSGAQILDYAISGHPYYDKLFCRECPIPWGYTVIRPGLANVYYFLQNYAPENRQVAPIEKLYSRVHDSNEKNNPAWPLTSISLDQFMQNCLKLFCADGGMVIDDKNELQEIIKKIPTGRITVPAGIFFAGSPSNLISFEAVWPKASDVPPDYTLTCNRNAGQYSLLPLNKDNYFWYYAPNGKWGAERIHDQDKMRIVNTSGYERIYQYDAAFFGQAAIQVYPRFWSDDGQFFYVNVLPKPFTPNVSFIDSIGLQQIDVKNEKIKYLFLGAKGQTFAYEFSKDGKKVAYIRQGDRPLKLVVVDTYSGEEQAVSLTTPEGISYSSAGTLIWSDLADKIFLAANYEQSGLRKGHILVTLTDNLANIHILYEDSRLIKLLPDGFYDGYPDICEITADPNQSNCHIDLNMETGEIQDYRRK